MCSFKKEHAFSNRSEWNISDLDIEEEKESQQLVLIGGSLLNDLFLFFQLNRKLGKSLQECVLRRIVVASVGMPSRLYANRECVLRCSLLA